MSRVPQTRLELNLVPCGLAAERGSVSHIAPLLLPATQSFTSVNFFKFLKNNKKK